MKKFAFFPGCLMQTEQYAYELSLRNTLPLFDIELVDLQGASCCGEPLKSINQLMTLYLSARTIALAEKLKLPLFAPCAQCHMALSDCMHVAHNNAPTKERINAALAAEELHIDKGVKIVHTIDVLYDEIGVAEIKKKVTNPFNNPCIATHYGCRLIRPSRIGRPVDSENPQKMEEILTALGATSRDYAEKLDCCGAPLLHTHAETSLTKTGQKLQEIALSGFDGLADACPWCHKMFDAKQKKALETVGSKAAVPVFYLTQLLGLAMGVDRKKLGLDLNLSPVDTIEKKEAAS
jgi:heterodisulfide reductase subunit B